jgi:hypothetical protein
MPIIDTECWNNDNTSGISQEEAEKLIETAIQKFEDYENIYAVYLLKGLHKGGTEVETGSPHITISVRRKDNMANPKSYHVFTVNEENRTFSMMTASAEGGYHKVYR